MARRTRDIVIELHMGLEDLRIRSGTDAPTLRGGSVWRLRGPDIEGAPAPRETWLDSAGNTYEGRITVAYASGRWVTDAAAGTHRIARTPSVSATGFRSLRRVEPAELLPDGTDVGYRLYDGATERYWTGAAWAAAVADGANWNTPAELEAGAASWTASTLAVVARLSTTTWRASPSFYGARVVLRCAEVGDEDDALLRTLQPRLASDIRHGSFMLVDLASAAGPVDLTPEHPMVISEVNAVFDTTTDPGLTTALPGSYNSSTQVWTPTTPIPSGRTLRVEYTVAPTITVHRHRDLGPVSTLPNVRLYPAEGAPERRGGWSMGGVVRVRDRWDLGGLDTTGHGYVEQTLDVQVVEEFGSDARACADALQAWLGRAGERHLVSPVTGRIVLVRSLAEFASAPVSLGASVTTTRTTWSLGYHSCRVRELPVIPLISPDGIGLTVEAS